jgi:hypothetical protein
MTARGRLIALGLTCAGMAACSSHRDITIDGPYHLVATDDEAQMTLCYDAAEGCIGRIAPTVYAVGVDATYVVAARHPQADRSITEFYYLIRSADTPTVDTSAAVRGPFDAQAFALLRDQLHLPALTYELPQLK